jgi:hypothetical protein
LEENGYIQGEWESEKGRGRRIYKITESGINFLETGEKATLELDQIVKHINDGQILQEESGSESNSSHLDPVCCNIRQRRSTQDRIAYRIPANGGLVREYDSHVERG